MEQIQRDPYFEKFINLTVDFITSEVKQKLKEIKLTDDNSKLSLTPKEAAEILGIGVNAIYSLLKDKDFPSYKVGTKWLIYKQGLDEWIEKQINNK